MSHHLTVILCLWSALAAIWWLLALVLVVGRNSGAKPAPPGISASLTIFKALPPVADMAARDAIARAVDSFVRQLEPRMELLLGVPEESAAQWQACLTRWRGRGVRAFVRPAPRQHANPKVGWLELLAAEAQGTHWLWSDADIVAPEDLLRRLEGELTAAGGKTNAVSAAYFVGEVGEVNQLLDALFVNVEFLPGALLLRRLGPVRLSFGSAVLFPADCFKQRVNWTELGASLADDYVLGQKLAPVAVSSVLVETLVVQRTLRAALRHLYRWQKTIRWCQSVSFAALLMVMPLLGWLVACAVAPGSREAWLGLSAQWLVELLASAGLMKFVGIRMPLKCWLALPVWPAVRLLSWLAAWLPLPVVWTEGQATWRKPFRR